MLVTHLDENQVNSRENVPFKAGLCPVMFLPLKGRVI